MINFQNLNQSQKNAVEQTEGPVLVLSGAGTGKTTVITSRIANIIAKSNYTTGIIAMTFTNKASKEMRERATKILGGVSYDKLMVGTFHSISARFLRQHAKSINRTPNFIILDQKDSKKIMAGVVNDLGVDAKVYNLNTVCYLISKAKEDGIHINDERVESLSYNDLNLKPIFLEYQLRLKQLDSVDFSDLILEFYILLKNHPEILEAIQNEYQYFMVDEYQDTNGIQNALVEILASKYKNICCVGDEDQSIYSWRGAEIKHILNFEKSFKNAKIIKLEENYRSTQSIISTASELIANNLSRYDKKLFSSKESGDPVTAFYLSDCKEEANLIANLVQKAEDKGHSLDEMAILVRKNMQIRPIEETFIARGIKYKIIDGVKFYERKEVKDAISYLRFCYNPQDFLAFERIINTPKRGLGEKSIDDIIKFSRENGLNILDALTKMLEENLIRKSVRENVENFVQATNLIREEIEAFENKTSEIKLHEILQQILMRFGYIEMLSKEIDENEAEGYRMDNLRELTDVLSQFSTITEFLEHISLVSATDASNQEGVSLLTIHASKGLEYDVVILPGWEEGTMPSYKSEEENGMSGIEEERRLGYVAITRARKICLITSAKARRIFGKYTPQNHSRFLSEMTKLKNIYAYSTDGSLGGGSNFNANQIRQNSTQKFRQHFNRTKPKVKIQGNIVIHENFGEGLILSNSGGFLTVKFPDFKMMIKHSEVDFS